MRKIIDLTGQRFGRLVVIKYSHTDRHGNAMWLCKCDCGNETVVMGRSLRINHTTSCGCLYKEQRLKVNTTHKMSATRIYQTWSDMKQRCSNPKNKRYRSYGGRGITVCDEWLHDFQAFYNYVSQLPHFGEKGYSLDRINNNGNYEPGNVRWATNIEQSNNKRNSKKRMV